MRYDAYSYVFEALRKSNGCGVVQVGDAKFPIRFNGVSCDPANFAIEVDAEIPDFEPIRSSRHGSFTVHMDMESMYPTNMIDYSKMDRELFHKIMDRRIESVKKNMAPPKIKNVIFNDPATIVFWSDDTKTVVKTQQGDTYDPEKGLAMAIAKKYDGNNREYYNLFAKWLKKYYKENKEN